MTLFSESFLSGLVYGAMLMTALGAITLIVLLVRDIRNRKVW